MNGTKNKINHQDAFEADQKRTEQMRGVGQFLQDEVLPEIYGQPMGFILLVSPFNNGPGVADYLSNSELECCIKWLEETLARFKANETISAVKGNA